MVASASFSVMCARHLGALDKRLSHLLGNTGAGEKQHDDWLRMRGFLRILEAPHADERADPALDSGFCALDRGRITLHFMHSANTCL